jgi:chloride channel 3/4/5
MSRAILGAIFIKAVLTVVTFGIKLPAGIFIPSLTVGAGAGRILGVWIQWMQHQEPPIGIFRRLGRSCGEDGDCKFFRLLSRTLGLRYNHDQKVLFRVCTPW